MRQCLTFISVIITGVDSLSATVLDFNSVTGWPTIVTNVSTMVSCWISVSILYSSNCTALNVSQAPLLRGFDAFHSQSHKGWCIPFPGCCKAAGCGGVWGETSSELSFYFLLQWGKKVYSLVVALYFVGYVSDFRNVFYRWVSVWQPICIAIFSHLFMEAGGSVQAAFTSSWVPCKTERVQVSELVDSVVWI